MIALPAPAATKIAKLIPLLASDHDGEVVAAARAVVRTLTSVGFDLHALATVVSAPLAPAPLSMTEMAIWCLHNGGGRLTLRKRKFVSEMARCPSHRMTEPQRNWLRAIYAELNGARA